VTRAPPRTVALALLLSACSHAVPPAASDAGPPKPKRVHLVDGGPPPSARVTCGETACPEPANADVLGEIACCLPSGECGIRSPLLGNRCLERGQPGSIDGRCPSFVTPGGARAQGCCAPSGHCGTFDRLGDLGCVLADTSDAAARCDYDPGSMCRSVITITCDGPEDCAPGNICCGRLNVGLYDAFACFPSCEAAESAGRGVWVETCHSTGDCRSPYDRCGKVDGLPPHLARCIPIEAVRAEGGTVRDASAVREGGSGGASSAGGSGGASSAGGSGGASPHDAGIDSAMSSDAGVGVRCGEGSCERGGACCSRIPGEAYCAAPGEACACAGPRARDR
jgi:hypothetical protein